MVLDIIVGVILIGTTVYGLRKGFVFTFIHTVGWILAAVLAYLATPFVKEFLVDKTTVYEAIEEDLDLRFSDSVPVMETSEKSVPLNISDILQNSTEIVSSKMAEIFAGLVFTVLVFIALLTFLKIILWLILRLLSRDCRDGFAGFADGFFGLIVGFIKGAVIVFIFLALLLPVTNLINPDSSKMKVETLENSYFAGELYDNNFIMVLLQGFIF